MPQYQTDEDDDGFKDVNMTNWKGNRVPSGLSMMSTSSSTIPFNQEQLPQTTFSNNSPTGFDSGVQNDNILIFSTTKLRTSSQISALFAGFALVALVETDLVGNIPGELLVAFAVTTSLLIFVHLTALLIATCLMPSAEGYSELKNINQPTLVMKETFHRLTRRYIALAWFFTTVLGTFLFMAEIIIVAWVRFYLVSKPACYAVTIIIVPLMLVSALLASRVYNIIVQSEISYAEGTVNVATRVMQDVV